MSVAAASISVSDVEDAFRAVMIERGLTPPDKLIPDGKLHRCDASEKPGKRDGAYLLFLDDLPAGGVENWRDGRGWQTWCARDLRKLSPSESAAHRRRMDAARRARDAETDARAKDAAALAARILAEAEPAGDHPYLERKGVKAHGLKISRGKLVVPVRDADGVLHSLQFIGADGTKRFLKGGRIKGGYVAIGELTGGAFCIAEGYATAATIFETTGIPSVAAFDAGNLQPVAEALRKKSPNARITIAADDDANVEGNPGLTKATAAARAIGALLAVPDFGENRPGDATDVNDLLHAQGPEAVRRCIKAADSPTETGEPGRWLTPSERVLTLGAGRMPLSTGFRTLDANTRGGIRPGPVVIGGAPGAGKTAWLTFMSLRWALADVHVSFLAADEEPSDVLIRIGQMLGFLREDLEEARPATLSLLAARLKAIPTLALLDGADVSVEDAAEDLRSRARGAPAVLAVDSIQTATALGKDSAGDARARTDIVVSALKRAGTSGLTVLATCELARGAYRSSNPAERTEGLAAFKESGSIEHAAKLALVLTSAKGEPGTTDVATVKNRWGSGKAPMRLVLNFATHGLTETASPDDELQAGVGDFSTQLQTDTAAARAALAAHPGVAGIYGLAAHLPGMSHARQTRAAKALLDAGLVRVEHGSRNSVRWFLGESPPAPLSLPGVSPGNDAGRVSPAPPAPIGRGDCGGRLSAPPADSVEPEALGESRLGEPDDGATGDPEEIP